MNLPRPQPLVAHAHAVHLRHENERMREALDLIAKMSEHSTSALVLQDVARIARNALGPVYPPNPALTIEV